MKKNPDLANFARQMNAPKASGEGEVIGRQSRLTRFAGWLLRKFGLVSEER